MKKVLVSLVFIFILFNIFGTEQKTFIVLSGGGAKGIGHLAFMRNIKENNIDFQGIVGVSAGSIAAALYSYYNGNIDKLESIAQKLYRLDIFEKIGDKFDTDKDNKKIPVFTIFFSEIKLLKKNYLFNITEIKNFFYSIFRDINIEDLPIPIYIDALNINTGKYTVFTKGKLVPRLLASMAIPGVFPPQEINGEYYVDGGTLDNVPVSVAYLMGATTVYLSDISDILKNNKGISSGDELFLKLQNIKSNYLNSFERKLSTYYIVYDFQNMKWYSFDKYKRIYNIAQNTIKKGFIKNSEININNILWYVKNQDIIVK